MGIDPGLTKTGFAILDNNKLLNSGVIKKNGDIIERIHGITSSIKNIIRKHKPSCSGIETVFYGKNQKSVIRAAQLIGSILYLLKDNDVEIIQFHPNVLKQIITGSGRASKNQVSFMIQKLLYINRELQPDESDAIAIALATSLYYDRRD